MLFQALGNRRYDIDLSVRQHRLC